MQACRVSERDIKQGRAKLKARHAEREALAVHVELCLEGAPRLSARARGAKFLERYPSSPWAGAIRRELVSPPEVHR